MMLLSDFRSAEAEISEVYFTDLNQTAALMEAFLAIENRLTDEQRKQIADALCGKGTGIDTLEDAEDWLDRQVELYFGKTAAMKGHLDADARSYMDQPLAWIGETMREEEDRRRGWALVYLTMLCWIFAAELDRLDAGVRMLMLSVCQGRDVPQEIREMRHLDTLHVSWDVNGSVPLVRRTLVNALDRPIEVEIKRDGRKNGMLVCMAAHSRWLSLWAGDRVTLLKGSITENGVYAYAQQGRKLQTLCLSARQPASSRETGVLTDMAAGDKNNLYTVRGHAFSVPQSRQTIDDALAVFSVGTVWAVLREGGGVLSNDARLLKNAGVIAVVRTGSGLCLIGRDGMTAGVDGGRLKEQKMDETLRDVLMDNMLSHLVDATDQILPPVSERVCCGAHRAALTADGRLIRET